MSAVAAKVRTQPAWRGLGAQILLAMVLGIALGLLAPSVALQCKILGDIFLRLIRTAIAPLVFLCVASGIVAAGDFRRVTKRTLEHDTTPRAAAVELGLLSGEEYDRHVDPAALAIQNGRPR